MAQSHRHCPRSLANAARMLQDNPQLMQLRMLQAMGESAGNMLVLDCPAALPLRNGKGVSDGRDQAE
jgi:hypothetical protein